MDVFFDDGVLKAIIYLYFSSVTMTHLAFHPELNGFDLYLGSKPFIASKDSIREQLLFNTVCTADS